MNCGVCQNSRKFRPFWKRDPFFQCNIMSLFWSSDFSRSKNAGKQGTKKDKSNESLLAAVTSKNQRTPGIKGLESLFHQIPSHFWQILLYPNLNPASDSIFSSMLTWYSLVFSSLQECASMPCKNSARCIDSANGFKCECPAGFSGKYCEDNIDNCEKNKQCLNDAVCVDGDDDFSCSCKAGYAGSRLNMKMLEFWALASNLCKALELKALIQPACLADGIFWLAFVVTIFMYHGIGDNEGQPRDGTSKVC